MPRAAGACEPPWVGGANTRPSDAAGNPSPVRLRESRLARSFEARIVRPTSGARSTEALHHNTIMAVIEPLRIWATPLRPILSKPARLPSEFRQFEHRPTAKGQLPVSVPNVRPTTARSPWIAVRCM